MTTDGSSPQCGASSREERLQRLLADVAARRLAGEDLPDRDIIATHADLMPELGRQLAAIGRVEQAQRHAIANPDGRETEVVTLTSTRPRAALRHRDATNVPKTLGTYRLLEELGRGGMGCVWLAENTLLKQRVAIKFLLHIHRDHDAFDADEFFTGPRSAVNIQHPNLCRIYAADVVGDIPYIVHEFIDGMSVGQLYRRGGALAEDEVLYVLHAVAKALSELHRNDICHRDVKPDNIMLSRTGAILLTDFGLCVRLMGGLSRVGVAGTPIFMPPESQPSPKADVYCLGLTAHVLLTGVLPDRALDRQSAAFEKSLRAQLVAASVSDPWCEFVRRCTRPNPIYRFKNGAQAAAYLGDMTGSHGAQATRDRLLARMSPDAGTPAISADDAPPKSYYDALSAVAMSRKDAKVAEAAVETPIRPFRGGPPAARLHADVPCAGCGYNLRYQGIDDCCPECGVDVERSLDRTRLCFENRETLKPIIAALRMTLMCYTLVLVSPFVAVGVYRAGLTFLPAAAVIYSLITPALVTWLFYLGRLIDLLFDGSLESRPSPIPRSWKDWAPGALFAIIYPVYLIFKVIACISAFADNAEVFAQRFPHPTAVWLLRRQLPVFAATFFAQVAASLTLNLPLIVLVSSLHAWHLITLAVLLHATVRVAHNLVSCTELYAMGVYADDTSPLE